MPAALAARRADPYAAPSSTRGLQMGVPRLSASIWHQTCEREPPPTTRTLVIGVPISAMLSAPSRNAKTTPSWTARNMSPWLLNELIPYKTCLLYTSDAADEEDSVDLGGRRIIKKQKIKR